MGSELFKVGHNMKILPIRIYKYIVIKKKSITPYSCMDVEHHLRLPEQFSTEISLAGIRPDFFGGMV
ncbi:hypothetical protein Ptc2401_00865 [Prosthecochloris sp. CIB 2401]|nr:hypothetical protein Ptc2401_00865 [Prosthecochloris sp. CIB 2401]